MTGPISIRFATLADEPALLRFLEEHWRKNHIFIKHPELMRWQHAITRDPAGRLTFLLAERKSESASPELLGILGFIPFHHFHGNREWSDLSLAIWKVRDDAGTPGLGIQMLKALQSAYKPAMIAAIGISGMVKPMYQAMGYRLGHLAQAALFPEDDPACKTTDLNVPMIARQSLTPDPEVRLEPVALGHESEGDVSAEIDALAAAQVPRKSWAYLVARYHDHPSYRYTLRAVTIRGQLEAVLVWRSVAAPFGTILRIVDLVGAPESLARCGTLLRDELRVADACYIDLMAWGVDMAVLSRGGFVSLDDYPDLVLPNYFSPYEARNIRIDLAVKTIRSIEDLPLRLYRADSDQDRPNLSEDMVAEKETDPR